MRGKRLLAGACALALLFGSACAAVENIADQCAFQVSEGSAGEITDSSISTAWTPRGENAELRIKLPDSGAAHIQINWSIPSTDHTLTEYDAAQNEIATHSAADDDFAGICELLEIQPEARYLSIRFTQRGQGINKIRIFPEGELPNTVIRWEKPLDKCELMVISTHQDDEWLWFGPLIPYYDLVMDRDVQVVYMANCGRYRYAEALNALAVSGVTTYPHFIGLVDGYRKSLAESVTMWESVEHVEDELAAVIRRYKPEVILTQDWNGEYGHPQHIITSRCMEGAIAAAADPNRDPESAAQYGTWQVKKLYRHLEERGRIEFDWHVPYPEFGGKTGIQVAIDAMNENVTQLGNWHVEDKGEYDNSLFGLSYSIVGDDVRHDDLFENIPDPTATPGPAPEATPEPTAAAEPVKEGGGGPGAIAWIAAAAIVAVAGGAGYILYSRAQRRKRLRKKRAARAAKKARTPPARPRRARSRPRRKLPSMLRPGRSTPGSPSDPSAGTVAHRPRFFARSP